MNMNRKFAFCAMAAVVLSACSDGNLSSTEALGENWPADFSVSEYAEVNPDLANYQIIAAVSEVNNGVIEKVKQDSIKAWKAAMAPAQLDSIKAAVSAKDATLDGAALDSAVDATIVASMKKRLESVRPSLKDESERNLFFNDSNAVKTIFVEYANINASYWPGMNALKLGVKDSTNLLDGARAEEYSVSLERFHCLGNTATQDLAFLNSKKNSIDMTLIEKHYLLSGRYEGRPYRYCHDGEANYLKFATVVTVDTVADTTWEYVTKDTVILDSTALNPIRYVLYNETTDSTIEKSVRGLNLDSLKEAGFEVKDSVLWTVTEKETTIKVDSSMTVADKYATTITQTPVSANAKAFSGNMDRVWDFSADYYCLNKADGNIYIIEQ